MTVAKVLAFPDLAGLERVAAQNLDKQQVVVRAILVRLPALDVRGPVDAARVVISESARVLPRERVRWCLSDGGGGVGLGGWVGG